MSAAVVLMYHRLGSGALADREDGEHVYAVAPDTFEAHLEILDTAGCSVPTLEEATRACSGDALLPPRSVVLTFDDGNASDHAAALPALLRRGRQAAFFVSPAVVGRPGFMGWPDVRELARAGMTIGAHGFEHVALPSLGYAELLSQLREARRAIHDRIGRMPDALSFPGGFGGAREKTAAHEAGFRVVLGSVPRRLAFDASRKAWPRFAVRRGLSPAAFRGLVEQRPLVLARHALRYSAIARLRTALGERLFRAVRRAWAYQGGAWS